MGGNKTHGYRRGNASGRNGGGRWFCSGCNALHSELRKQNAGFQAAWHDRETCDSVLNDGAPPAPWLDIVQRNRDEAQRRIEMQGGEK